MVGARSSSLVQPHTVELLERAAHLSALDAAFTTVRVEGRGQLVLLGGEAGVGKTALVQRFCADYAHPGPVLWGACDPLFTPRPLGPFIDIAMHSTDDALHGVLTGAKPPEIATSIGQLGRERAGAVVVLEDMHWADEATLDVLSLLGRRIEATPILLIATYRDDELERTHPLRMLLGELRAPDSIRRLKVQPLSAQAVEILARPHDVDADALYRATSGNAFFVSEALAADSDAIPSTVREAVLARAARLSDAAAAVIEAVAIAPPQVELWLLDALVGDDAGAIDECLASGMLESVSDGVAFRHDLARIAIEQSVQPHRAFVLHGRALQALRTPPTGKPDLARVAHHADACGDATAVLEFALAAADDAAATGAHREAAAQLERALRYAGDLDPRERAALLERRSFECYLTEQGADSVTALEQAVQLRREIGDDVGEGAALSSLSRRLWCAGRVHEARTAGLLALRLLENLPPGRELALAYSNLAQISLNNELLDDTIMWSTRALELAEPFGDVAIVSHSLNNIGTMQLLAQIPEGLAHLERSLAIAEEADLDEHVGRAFIHVGWIMMRTRSFELLPVLERGIEVCAERGLERWGHYLIAYRARARLDRGEWNEAAADAASLLRNDGQPLLRLLALSVLGLVRARRGDPDSWPLLDEALAIANDQDELQYLAPITTARAEATFLGGRGAGTVDAATRPTLDAATRRDAAWVIGELAWLRRLAGVRETVEGSAEPYALQLAGEGQAAASRWTDLGCPYDAALALLDTDDDDALRYAHAEFQRLGAQPAAAIAARRLRDRGARGLPRGPRPATLQHPANLTKREAEILVLVAEGLPNAEIADLLFLSDRTVQHHVSAILRKLGVGTRGQASAAAAKLGLLDAAAAIRQTT